ncbi:archease [Candidatus Micrarchaeota archaeon]|nr:archease [Candidatus Micrarchaeota archaeon]
MYKFLEHVSDIYLEAKGKNLEETITELLKGTIGLMGKGKGGTEFRISGKGEKKGEQIISLLENLVAEVEIQGITPTEVIRVELGEEKITAYLKAEKKPPENIIKAVTYHLFEFKKEKKGYLVRVLFDI